MEKRFRARVTGIVQGVGFRPFVYNLAISRQLKGLVRNTPSGVYLEVQGEGQDLEDFFASLLSSHPPLARILDMEREEIPLDHGRGFSILESNGGDEPTGLISPDIATCEDCLRELFDPSDRRFLYPFINCTNCGPRYTILKGIPYDRENTTMEAFPMCPICKAEYEAPTNRRFHAQPNACHDCGPRVWLADRWGKELTHFDPIGEAKMLLAKGHILAIKGLGGFHFAVDAQNTRAVRTLRERKGREEKPFAIMVRDLEALRPIALFNRRERYLLESRERPIVLLRKRKGHNLSGEVSPGNLFFGVMLPYTPLHHLLMQGPYPALVMTSGNISEEPIVAVNEEAIRRLGRVADYFLFHNRAIQQRADDSVFKVVVGKARPIRRSRGYVPLPIFLRKELCELPEIIGLGPELKNTICLLKGNKAILSQHIGDMENLETMDYFIETLATLKRLFGIEPKVIGHDLHPDYMTTRYAEEMGVGLKIPIQHHHAHIVSCMVENNEMGPVIGVALDGTGYGEDGTIWGGEILSCHLDSYERLGHLEPLSILGGDTSMRYPWKVGLSLLWRTFKEDALGLSRALMKNVPHKDLEICLHALKNNMNCTITTSAGRLFDGVSALTGLRTKNAYEGQAAILLEMAQAPERCIPYETKVDWSSGRLLLRTGPITEGIVKDLLAGKRPGHISRRFHISFAGLIYEGVRIAAKRTGISKVALSGGCFQNATLLGLVKRMLSRVGLQVFTHHTVPTNDGGVSLGQAVAAGLISVKGE